MRRIVKGQEPPSLKAVRETEGASWGGYGGKQDARELLCAEQGHLCAYCMSRIAPSESKMKIEHWDARSSNRDLWFDWSNLIGVCYGREKEACARNERHCDTSRGHQALHVHPAKFPPDASTLFRYPADGSIRSATNDKDTEDDIACLNLNTYRLSENRKQVIEDLKRNLGAGPWKITAIRTLLDKWSRLNGEGKLREFVQVAVYHLERWRRKHEP